MTARNPLIAPLVAIALCLGCPAFAQISAQLSTRHLARGEQAYLEIILPPGRPTSALPVIPSIPDVTVRATDPSALSRPMPGRRIEYFYQYVVESYAVGRHTIPAVEWLINGLKTRTEPIEFVVFNPDELQWHEATVAGQPLRYAAGFHILKDRPYAGETIPVEIKIFVPSEFAITVEDWGIPEFQLDGVACWRLEPSPTKGQLNVLGKAYASLAYPSTLTPTRGGKVGIGPAKLRLTSTQSMILNGFHQRFTEESFLAIPKLDFETMPLPPGAPAGFDNAIGSFTLHAHTGETEVHEGDPISVDVNVTGSGNLDTMRPPHLLQPKGWKIYEATATQRGDERRRLSGSVIFQQLIKPLDLQAAVPPFCLVYFDPILKQYRSITTEPIPLKILPSTAASAQPAGPPQALPIPVERMTDILAVLHPAQDLIPEHPALPPWLGHAIGAALAFCLIAKALWMRLSSRLRPNRLKAVELRALHELERTPADNDTLFLRQAGAFVERWLGGQPNPGLQAILAERDTHCFLAEKPTSFLGKRRKEILKLLRQAITTAIVLAALAALPTSASAATKDAAKSDAAKSDASPGQPLAAYASANYEDAIKLWLAAGDYARLSPAVLYNIGNACYRLGSPGYAALYYRRALAREPGHEESRQNLRFIERKCGSLSVQRPDYQYALARLPLRLWQAGVWTGLWLCVLALLVFPATRDGARIRIAAIFTLVLAPLLVTLGVLGCHYYPDDAEFVPVANQAVIVAEKIVVHADASRSSPEVIDAPPGSLCELVNLSGEWAYIAFASKTRGWIPAAALEKVIPEKPPAPPKIRKPPATERSA